MIDMPSGVTTGGGGGGTGARAPPPPPNRLAIFFLLLLVIEVCDVRLGKMPNTSQENCEIFAPDGALTLICIAAYLKCIEMHNFSSLAPLARIYYLNVSVLSIYCCL